MPFKVNIEVSVENMKCYHEDPTINRTSCKILANQEIISNVELKKNMAVSWQGLNLDHLIEALLYAKYYFSSHQANKEIFTVLTDFFTWHIFHLRNMDERMELIKYYAFSTCDVSEIQNFVCAFLLLLKKTML